MLNAIRDKKFFDKVMQTETCWLWTAHLNNKGYGQFYFDGKVGLAHRYSYIRIFGKIPKALKVLHKCDNPQCVNPEHLFLGTQLDNVKDMLNKKRHASQRQTQCKYGHVLEAKDNKRQRICKICTNIAKKKYRSLNRQAHLEYMREYNKTYKRSEK